MAKSLSVSEQKLCVGLILFPNVTQLDLTGPFEVFARMPDTEVILLWKTLDPVKSDRGLSILPTTRFDDCAALDILCVPGGPGQIDLMEDEETLHFLRRITPGCRLVTSVCTGSLLLGAAGLLKGYRATSHWGSVDQLALLGAMPVSERVVVDRNRITGAGVTSGIDFALTVAAEILGSEAAKEIQLQMEYDPAPPFRSGSPRSAAPELVDLVRGKIAAFLQRRMEATERAAAKLVVVLLLAGLIFPLSLHAQSLQNNGPAPLSVAEQKAFYPLICRLPPLFLGPNAPCEDFTPTSSGASSEITFRIVIYGSFTSKKADQALVLFSRTNITRSTDGGLGAALLDHGGGAWKLLDVRMGSSFDTCVALPEPGPQRLLCLDVPKLCCGNSSYSIKIISYAHLDADGLKSDQVLTSGDNGEAAFCALGAAGKTALVEIGNLQSSTMTGVFATADVAYVTPLEIGRACPNEKPEDAEVFEGQIQFALEDGNIKMYMPDGINFVSAR